MGEKHTGGIKMTRDIFDMMQINGLIKIINSRICIM
ncbi:hypothetical protein Q428_12670 [Fervidicella metallireducens AeB]|uniref:Uncharacterized protein n=1 Tax=Fervidicella metallireducens AeB TaxID=1403537 RepID=A0A017RSG9_9CLOT|nr:hypothetical protein Q428_12670 [Fervidicella metallireducens AeB]